jgi:hypothetical protein
MEGAIDHASLLAPFPDADAMPWMTRDECRVYFWRRYAILYLICGYRRPGQPQSWWERRFDLHGLGKHVFTVSVPSRVGAPVRKNDEEFRSSIAWRSNAAGGRSLLLDVVTEWRDTGGYFTRTTAAVHLDAADALLGFVGKRFYAGHRWFLFGPYRRFRLSQEIRGGDAGLAVAEAAQP